MARPGPGNAAGRRENLPTTLHTLRMDPNAPRDNPWPGQPDAYWRRRVFALVAGLGLLGMLAWACSGALGGGTPPRQQAGNPASAAAQQGPASSRPVVASSPTAAATVTVTATPSRRPHSGLTATPRASASPGASGSAGAAAQGRRGGRCPAADVVPSLFVSQQVYQRSIEPQFSVYLVNIGHATCTFDVGARSLRLLIRSGQVRVWGSADCAHRAPPDVVRLRRGVPFVTYLWWNRRRSTEGCGPAGPKAAPGTYTASVSSGAVHSHAEVFVLR